MSDAPVTSPPSGVPAVLPHLPYADIETAVAFLERAFGFEEDRDARVETPSGLVHAELLVGNGNPGGNGRVMLGTPGGHGASPPRASGHASAMLCVYVADVDAHYARARDSGAEVQGAPVDRFFGDRVYEALDCEGHRWSFHQHTGRRFDFDEC